MISRKEVAKLAGVSEATVSRVLNGVGPMKEETRRRVQEAADQLGYVPSALAQRFARRRSGNLGVILPFVPKVHLFSTYYFSEILSGIGETAKQHGYDLLLMFREPEEKRDYAMLFRTQKVDACIVLGAQDIPEEREALAELKAEGHPFCLVNQRFEEELGYMAVDADHENGSFEAVTQLIASGYSRIAFLNGPERYSNSRDRLAGYERALQASGLPVRGELLHEGNYSRKSGYEAASILSDKIKAGKVDAVFAANDRMAIGLMQRFAELGMKTGVDVAVVGYDNSDGSRLVHPQLSSVSVPFYEMGQLAASLLLSEEAKGEASSLLPVSYIGRESSTPRRE
ncbi:LacI family DNA-binding transcriptional regulator [Paenibacillus sp. GCM10023252]|uniref:LacI family DNA-binding transcriptional regulator n=1 Tax=Paenibacillus sp. GCM10023252 TaxID=3252649 RepID=UPI00360D3CAB